jgi:hypothetical protein
LKKGRLRKQEGTGFYVFLCLECFRRGVFRGRLLKDGYARQSKKNAAHVAQLVEHVLGKDEVIGSNPIVGSSIKMNGADAGWELSRTRSSEIRKLGKQTGGEHGQRKI